MQNQVIPNGSKVGTKYGVFEIIDYDNVDDSYFCYQQGFDGHSGIGCFGRKYLNTKYEGSCWWFSENEVTLIEESKVNGTKQSKFKAGDKVVCTDSGIIARGVYYGKEYTIENPSSHFGHYFGKTHNHVTLVGVEGTPSENSLELVKENKDYRKMKPTDSIDIVLDGKGFKVPLGDLVHTTAMLGVTNGYYGFRFWKGLIDSLGECGFIKDSEYLIEVRDYQKKAIDYFFKPHYDEKEKKELEAQIVAKSNELFELQAKLKDLQN